MRKFLNAILISILAIAPLFIMGVALAQDRQVYEYYNTNDDTANAIHGVNWFGQTFNVTNSHTIDAVRLRLYQAGTAGYLYVGIRECGESGLPEGVDLTSGVYDGELLITNTDGSFREISLTEYTLKADTTYAIVVYSTGADASNCVKWRSDDSTPTYDDGYFISSVNDGITWVGDTDKDFMFEVYGSPSFEIVGAQVYSGYLEEDDWLIVVNYINEVSPYYPLDNPENYWLLQLMDGSTILSSQPLRQWGQRPGSLYLNAVTTSTMEWQNDYTIRLYGNYGANPTTSYSFSAVDWIGSSLGQLDTWCINLARTIEEREGKEYLTEAEDGDVLNTAGGAMFTKGIPWLPETRPDIFQYSLSTLEYTESDWTNAYEESLGTWESWMGDTVTDLANKAGALVGLSGEWALGLFFFGVYIIIASIGMFAGRITEGLILAAPMILLAMNWKIIPMALVATFIMIWVYKWIKREYFEST